MPLNALTTLNAAPRLLAPTWTNVPYSWVFRIIVTWSLLIVSKVMQERALSADVSEDSNSPLMIPRRPLVSISTSALMEVITVPNMLNAITYTDHSHVPAMTDTMIPTVMELSAKIEMSVPRIHHAILLQRFATT